MCLFYNILSASLKVSITKQHIEDFILLGLYIFTLKLIKGREKLVWWPLIYNSEVFVVLKQNREKKRGYWVFPHLLEGMWV